MATPSASQLASAVVGSATPGPRRFGHVHRPVAPVRSRDRGSRRRRAGRPSWFPAMPAGQGPLRLTGRVTGPLSDPQFKYSAQSTGRGPARHPHAGLHRRGHHLADRHLRRPAADRNRHWLGRGRRTAAPRARRPEQPVLAEVGQRLDRQPRPGLSAPAGRPDWHGGHRLCPGALAGHGPRVRDGGGRRHIRASIRAGAPARPGQRGGVARPLDAARSAGTRRRHHRRHRNGHHRQRGRHHRRRRCSARSACPARICSRRWPRPGGRSRTCPTCPHGSSTARSCSTAPSTARSASRASPARRSPSALRLRDLPAMTRVRELCRHAVAPRRVEDHGPRRGRAIASREAPPSSSTRTRRRARSPRRSGTPQPLLTALLGTAEGECGRRRR